MNSFMQNYFHYSKPNIAENEQLREPQKDGYLRLYKHFVIDNQTDPAIVILPTGVGKTGLMAIAPFQIARGRVLIITPQLTIKETLIRELDSDRHDNFYLRTKIFDTKNDLPTIIEFDKTLPIQVLSSAHLTIINIQKLQDRLERSPLNFLPSDFYDMIIIDEAHHSAANTWISTCEHFSNAKVIKVTATPIRSDGKDISGKLVFRYKLSQAMNKGYVKSLRKFDYVPDTLLLTLDGDESKKYTPDQIFDLELKDEDWIKRTVSLSHDCSTSVVLESIERLNAKRNGTDVPHKIIAVASSIAHAESIADLYIQNGLRTAIIHHQLTASQKEVVFSDIENHRVDVVVNCSMLGEGYDHKYLTVGAIFRAFKNVLPYAQFVGRTLRSIPDSEIRKPDDNIAEIVAHKYLYLEDLWAMYKLEIEESEIIKHLSNFDDYDFVDIGPSDGNRIVDIGSASESDSGSLLSSDYLTTELIKAAEIESKKLEEQIKKLMDAFSINRREASEMIDFMNHKNDRLLRPDVMYKTDKQYVNKRITEELVPEIIIRNDIDQYANNLNTSPLFRGPYSWIVPKAKDNGALLAMYFNEYLRLDIGRNRAIWTADDCKKALSMLDDIAAHIERNLK